jgi:MoaA/NifB/PqqE/SkfB family radical SAM enzyme
MNMQNCPSTFALETVCGCNLRCVECAVGGNLITRPGGVLALADYRRASAALRPHCRYLYLHLWGEPMLHPHIFTMIADASSFCRTNISTNAQTVDEAMAQRLIESGVSEIIVSIDGMTQATYETYRRGGDLGKALQGLDSLARFNERAGNPVRIMPQFIVFAHNEHEMEAFRQFCTQRGLTTTFKAPYLRAGSHLRPSSLPGMTRVRNAPDQRAQAMRACPNAADTMTILRDGSVVACCYDHDGVTSFGNIFETSVEAVWDSPGFKSFRDRLKQGAPPAFCRDQCLLY